MGRVSPVAVGVVGCGKISGIYLTNCSAFPNLRVLACADLDLERARAAAAEFGVPRVCSVQELLADPEIEVILNLTVPAAHAEISLAALERGKHVYGEKPLAISREDGRRILDTASSRGLLVGCAPDTFLSSAFQTCRRLVDEGAIGEPEAATAFMMIPGHESWHPDPDFYYQPGGGPMFDMGPYYLTALISLIGPVRRVTGSARITLPERTITSRPRYGATIAVEVPTHVAGVMDFAGGAIGTIITSFDVQSHGLPPIELYGTEGTLGLPDPNSFGGTIRIRRADAADWSEVTPALPYRGNDRGVGLADMARAVRSGGSFRANGALAHHVLDIMHAFHDASVEGRHVELQSTCDRPAPLTESATQAAE
jgi:predicted dehydrogenase